MELLVENENVYPIELPGLVGAQLILTEEKKGALSHRELKGVFGGDLRLQRFSEKDTPQYVGRVGLYYWNKNVTIADIVQRVFTNRRQGRLRELIKAYYEEGRMDIRGLYLFDSPRGELTRITIPLHAIVHAKRRFVNSRKGYVPLHGSEERDEQYLHYGQDGTILFVRMPVQGKPGLALLLSKRVVNTIIASYALALVGPHREWLATLAKPPAP